MNESNLKPISTIFIENILLGMFLGAFLGTLYLFVIVMASWFVAWFSTGFPSIIDVVSRILAILLYTAVPGIIVGGIAGLILGLFNGIVVSIMTRLPYRIIDNTFVYVGSGLLVIVVSLILSFAIFYRIATPYMSVASWLDSPLALPASLIAAIASLIVYQRNLKRNLGQSANPNTANSIQQ